MLPSIFLVLACLNADPPSDDDDTPVFIDDGTLELGFYEDTVWNALGDGEPCWVIHGIQGGTWTMPVLRVTGLGELATVTCTVDTASERVGETVANVRFEAGAAETLEYPGFPIAIASSAGVDALYGQSAVVACSVVDTETHRGMTEVSVVLEEGYDPVWSADTDAASDRR